MTDTDETGDGRDEQTVSGLLGAIREVVDSLVEAERDGMTTFGKRGRTQGGRFTIEYGFSGRIGRPPQSTDSGATDRSGGKPSRTRSTGDTTGTGEESYLVDVRETDDGLLVVADLPAVDAEDVTAGINEDRDELVVAVDDDQVERIALPWPVETGDVQFKHDVLELRFERAEDDP